MKHELHAVHLTLTDDLKLAVADHLVAPLERLLGGSEAAELEVHLRDTNGCKGGQDKECSATLRIPGHNALHVTELTEDLIKSIQLTEDRLKRMARKALDQQARE